MGTSLPFFAVESFTYRTFGQPSSLCNGPIQAHLSESPILLTDRGTKAVLLILLHFATNFVLNCIVFVSDSM